MTHRPVCPDCGAEGPESILGFAEARALCHNLMTGHDMTAERVD